MVACEPECLGPGLGEYCFSLSYPLQERACRGHISAANQAGSSPDLDAQQQIAVQRALDEERAAQEARSARVLEILQAKDVALAESHAAEDELQQQVRMFVDLAVICLLA
jgi:hypothetical protein